MGNEANTIPEDETLEEKIERVHGALKKDRKAMVAARQRRTRAGGSYVLDGENLDPDGNDAKKGVLPVTPSPKPVAEAEEVEEIEE